MTRGIDYGMGQTNIDKSNGIRYGVISQNAVLQAWCDSSEPNYGEPHCPKCGNPAIDAADISEDAEYEHLHHACGDWGCNDCEVMFDAEDAFGDSPLSHYVDDGEYLAECGEDGDIFVMKSPYYTRAAFCSPCAPGACYLTSPDDDGDRAYCFGPDWFYDGEPCPYPVFRVDDDSLVYWPGGYFTGILSFSEDYWYGIRAIHDSDADYHAGLNATAYQWECGIPWRTGFYVNRQ